MWQNKQNHVSKWVKESQVPKSINTGPQALQRGEQPSPQLRAPRQTRSDLNHEQDQTDDGQPRWSSPSTQSKQTNVNDRVGFNALRYLVYSHRSS